MNAPPLETVRLKLRPFEARYAPVIAGWLSDRVERFWVAPSSVAAVRASDVLSWTQRDGAALVLLADGEALPCAYAELNRLRSHAQCLWIGHLIVDPAQRGRGWGTQFVRLLCGMAFDILGAARLALVVFPENRAALRCYRRCGFSIVGAEYHTFITSRRAHRMLRLELTAPAQRGRALPAAQDLPALRQQLRGA
ncbi:MAG TPA: GNAT family protein [Phycisphaerae bacterium]|jgi:RimJ/RimL family protein N-acetyltransferase